MTYAMAASPRIEYGWLKSPRFDLTFIMGVMVIALLSGGVILMNPALLPIVVLLDIWLLGYHHVIATFTKLAGTPEDRLENRFLIYHLPILVFISVLFLGVVIGIWIIATIYFFWQWYHYVRQSYGVYAFYRRKSSAPVPEHPWLSQAAIWCVPITGILYRCTQGWDEFLGLPIWMPKISIELVYVSGAISGIIITTWLALRLRAYFNRSLPLAQTLFMASHIVVFYVGYIAIADLSTGWVVANVWHNAQYILFVWLYNNNRFQKTATAPKTLLAWSSQPGYERVLVYFTLCLIATSVFYGSIMYGYDMLFKQSPEFLFAAYVITFQAVNFHHYIVDSIIWKARNKKNQAIMNIVERA